MISKRLAIAVAVIVLTGATAGQALAQQGGTPAPAAPTMASPTAPGAAPGTAPAATPTPAPAAAATPAPAARPTPVRRRKTPYGIKQLWSRPERPG